jgi:uncharacterized Zn-finger protein
MSKTLTPIERALVLWHYATPTIQPCCTASYDRLVEQGYLDYDGEEYRITPKGNKFVEMICEVPEPENKWVDPRVLLPRYKGKPGEKWCGRCYKYFMPTLIEDSRTTCPHCHTVWVVG